MISLRSFELGLAAVNMFGAFQKAYELEAFFNMVQWASPKVVVEIGAGRCGMSWAFSKFSSVEKLVVIDLPAGNWGGEGVEATQQRLQMIANNTQASVSFISGNSQSSECLEKVKEVLGDDTIDLLFIDGDHSYEGVKTDFLTYSPLVSKPGVIAFHDICEHKAESGCEVKKFWDEVKTSGIPDSEYTELVSEPLDWGGIGVVRW